MDIKIIVTATVALFVFSAVGIFLFYDSDDAKIDVLSIDGVEPTEYNVISGEIGRAHV